MKAKISDIDWEMMLSEIELTLLENYIVESLDSSDKSRWGEEYTFLDRISTQKSNEAVRLITKAFKYKLLEKIKELVN